MLFLIRTIIIFTQICSVMFCSVIFHIHQKFFITTVQLYRILASFSKHTYFARRRPTLQPQFKRDYLYICAVYVKFVFKSRCLSLCAIRPYTVLVNDLRICNCTRYILRRIISGNSAILFNVLIHCTLCQLYECRLRLHAISDIGIMNRFL